MSDKPSTDEWQGGGTDRRRNPERVKELEAQLAAERAKAAELIEQNKTFRAAQKACEDCDGPTMAEVQQLRDQLAAERLKCDTAIENCMVHRRIATELRKQLAAERAKVGK